MHNKYNYGFILSNYSYGKPCGPMLTSYLYLRELFSKGYGGKVLIINRSGSDIDKIKMEFEFAGEVDVVTTTSKLPLLIQLLFNWGFYALLLKMYKECKTVHVFWYPGLIFYLSSKMIAKSYFTMMDSQVRLIGTTINNTNSPGVLLKSLLALRVYKYYERKISKFSKFVNFVSADDILPGFNKSNVVITKLPIDEREKSVDIPLLLPKALLIPRPDSGLLSEFLETLTESDIPIYVLLNEELPWLNSYKSVRHIRYIDNYDDFFAKGGLVVLLDKGGAGATNRLLTTLRFKLPFCCTMDATRGHCDNLPNLIGKSDSMAELRRFSIDFVNERISNYNRDDFEDITSHYSSHAVIPLIQKYNQLKHAI